MPIAAGRFDGGAPSAVESVTLRQDCPMSPAVDRGIAAGARERLRIRAEAFTGSTAGLAGGNVQANLVILPRTLAHDFLRFAQANPKPCPVLAVSEPGDPRLPGTGRGSRHPHRSAEIPGVAGRRTGRRTSKPMPCMARRSGQLRPRLLVFVRAGIDRGGDRAAPYDLRLECADVPDQHPLRAGRAVRRPARRLDAAVGAGRRDPGGSDHLAVSLGAWRAGAYRPARGDRHRGAVAGPITATAFRSGAGNCRCSGPAASPRRR